MKNNLKKLLITSIVVAIFSALTIAGLAASAAGQYNAAFDSVEAVVTEAADESTPALQDGVWKAEYHDGSTRCFIINEKENSFTILNADKQTGVPSRCEYDASVGMYKMHIGSEDNTEIWRVIDNDGATAFVKDDNGALITLTFLTKDADAF